MSCSCMRMLVLLAFNLSIESLKPYYSIEITLVYSVRFIALIIG